MATGLKAQECTLSELLCAGVEMAMPPYQRSYSWDREEAEALFTDLLEISNTDTPHFIGAIVLVKEHSGRYLIVDGQQRLTTLTILLSVLRDCEQDQAQADALHKLIVDTPSTESGLPPVWRISLNHLDGPYFRSAVQVSGATLSELTEHNAGDSQTRMARNLDLYRHLIRDLPLHTRRQLVQATLTRLLLVKVVVEDWDGGYNVFRVLNTRGKAPNKHDIIKTDLLQHAGLSVSEANDFASQWSEHEARLGGSGFDDLLSQIHSLHSRRHKKSASEFRKSVIGRHSGDVRTFLEHDLPAYADAYIAISRGQLAFGELSPAISAPLNHLRLLDHQMWRASALKFLVSFNGPPEIALRIFNNLERLAYACMLVITDPRPRQKRYLRVAEAAGNPDTLLAPNSPLALSRDERRRITERLRSRFGAFAQRRAIALRLNAEIQGGRALGPNDSVTVEHVLPRMMGEDSPWNTAWPNSAIHRELVNTLGNFALLNQSANQKADTLGFEDKKALYFDTGEAEFALTRDIREHIAWTPDTVRTRTHHLTQILSQAWQLDKPLMD